MADARFEDGAEKPVRLMAANEEDLPVISALLQDALIESRNISWMKRHGRVAILMSRFRWEDQAAAQRSGRPFERVQSMLVIDSARALRAQGVSPRDPDLILSALSLDFMARVDGSGTLTLTLSGDGALAVDVECIDIRLQDVSRPYLSHSNQVPDHKIDG